jgi:hypothetical protein
LELALAVVISLATGFLAGYPFFVASGKQLRNEAACLRDESAKLRNMVKLITRALEEGGIAEFTKDENGDPHGLVFNRAVSDYLAIGQSAGGIASE